MNGDNFQTFDDLGDAYFSGLVRHFASAHTVVDVFDRYDNPESVEQSERDRRQSQGPSGGRYQVIAGRNVPPWRKFLNHKDNKADLVSFLCKYIVKKSEGYMAAHHRCTIYLAGGFTDGTVTMKLTKHGAISDDSMASTHEEADTRLILHVMEADRTYESKGTRGRTVVQASDTDVLVLLLHYFSQLKATEELWMFSGRTTPLTDKRRYIGVHAIYGVMGEAFCRILPAVHSISGCDTVSSFFGIGKKKVLKTLQDHGTEVYEEEFKLWGSNKLWCFLALRNFWWWTFLKEPLEDPRYSQIVTVNICIWYEHIYQTMCFGKIEVSLKTDH